MKKQNGITIVALCVTIIVISILTTITVQYGTNLISEVKLQDLRTNMLLIQAKTKEIVEEVNFQIVNLQDEAEINRIKTANLKGLNLKIVENDADTSLKEDVRDALEKTKTIEENEIDNCYYLNQADLKEIGVGDIECKQGEYYIVKYDIENIKVEVINTKGYKPRNDGNRYYTLTQLNKLTNGEI